MPDMALTLNRATIEDERNETQVMLIDQVRSNDQPKKMPGRVAQERDKYRPARQVWAMKHGLAVALQLDKGSRHYDPVEQRYIGRVTKWETLKGKLGLHDGLRGEYNYFYEMGADVVGDLLETAVMYGVIAQAGAYYTYEDVEDDVYSFRAQGKAAARREIIDRTGIVPRLREQCFRAARIVYRHQ
jgi:hypothetical protein